MPKKNSAAVALGRKGGKARAKKLSAEELSAQGKKAAEERWKQPQEQTEERGVARGAGLTPKSKRVAAQKSPKKRIQRG